MQIVDIPLGELQRALNKVRVRSPEVRQLVDTVQSLGKGVAKGIKIEPKLSEQQIRAKLNYAGRISKINLDIGVKGSLVVFARRTKKKN